MAFERLAPTIPSNIENGSFPMTKKFDDLFPGEHFGTWKSGQVQNQNCVPNLSRADSDSISRELSSTFDCKLEFFSAKSAEIDGAEMDSAVNHEVVSEELTIKSESLKQVLSYNNIDADDTKETTVVGEILDTALCETESSSKSDIQTSIFSFIKSETDPEMTSAVIGQ
jgi:hypothetical protein